VSIFDKLVVFLPLFQEIIINRVEEGKIYKIRRLQLFFKKISMRRRLNKSFGKEIIAKKH
jgi:hypothetical protein